MAKKSSKVAEPETFDLGDEPDEVDTAGGEIVAAGRSDVQEPDTAGTGIGGQEFDSLKEVQDALSGCSLHFSWFGILRAIPKSANATAAESIKARAKRFKGRNELIDTSLPQWKALTQIRTALQADYNYMTFPYVFDGQRLFRKEMRDTIWERVRRAQRELGHAAEEFQKIRPAIIEDAIRELGDGFDASLYPDDLSKKFVVTIREFSIEPPSYLRLTKMEEYKNELRNQLKDVRRSMDLFERQCQTQVGEALGRMTNALATGGNFKSTTVEGMQQTFARIAQMKFVGTAAFSASMKDAEKIINGVDVFSIRNSEKARKDAATKLEGLLARYKELREAAGGV